MASSGKDKFIKYFKGKDRVSTFAKGKKGQDVPVYETLIGTKKIDTIKDGSPIIVISGKEYQKRYFVEYEKNGSKKFGYLSDDNVGKPKNSKTKNPNLDRIVAIDFAQKGNETKFLFFDQEIKCLEFTSDKQLIDSITYGLKTVSGVSDSVRETFMNWFKNITKDIKWVVDVTDDEKNKFGVYLGELLIGLLALAKKEIGHINPLPWKSGEIKRFLVPSDSSFSGLDSFLETKTGEIIPISNKYGVGAAASFFSNILPKGVEHYKHLPNSIFKDIVKTSLNLRINAKKLKEKQGSKEILYEYGIREILNLDKSKVKNSYQVFEAIRKEKPSNEKNLVVAAIANYKDVDKKIVEALENSVTAFFSREVANQLQNDKVSKKEMLKILAAKNFYQANLEEKEWKKGKVKYKLVNSGSVELQIIGNKSAIKDINAKQGTVVYILKKKAS